MIVDEAYVDFRQQQSALPLIEKYENLLDRSDLFQVQIYGRYADRICLWAHPKLIKYLNDVKYSFNSYTMDQNCSWQQVWQR